MHLFDYFYISADNNIIPFGYILLYSKTFSIFRISQEYSFCGFGCEFSSSVFCSSQTLYFRIRVGDFLMVFVVSISHMGNCLWELLLGFYLSNSLQCLLLLPKIKPGILASSIRHLALSISDRFFLSLMPFCFGVYGADNLRLIPLSLRNLSNALDLYSPPLSDCRFWIFFLRNSSTLHETFPCLSTV